MSKQLFDDWPERYERWFSTPLGRAVLKHELTLVLDLLRPAPGERILDAGSGTGIFSRAFLQRGADVTGLDISLAMLKGAAAACQEVPYRGVAADMCHLPFADGSFDKVVSVTALEFIADEKRAVEELFRVVRPNGAVVVATLNSLSPWAVRRKAGARRDPESVFNRVIFRSPVQLLASTLVSGIVRTAIHFGPETDPVDFDRVEGAEEGKETGAFVAARWEKR